MIPVETHVERILASIAMLPVVTVPLAEAHGCVLAQDADSAVDLPGFSNSSMDGYAVRSSDVSDASAVLPVPLPVDGDIAAGDTSRHQLQPGRSLRIMTGAPMPQGADCVVPVEETDGGTRTVHIRKPSQPGRFVREKAEDVRAGQTVITAGTVLAARHLGVLAASGRDTVPVHPRATVALLSTGDELVPPGTLPGFGQVVDANAVMLAALVRDVGARPLILPPVGDDEEDVTRVLDGAAEAADVIVTTGGVSMGAYDAVKAALVRRGGVEFVQVAMQPGKPQGFGTLGSVPIFTLPGNPVSALVSFLVFVVPALRRMSGLEGNGLVTVAVRAAHDWTSPQGRRQFARVRLEGDSPGLLAHLSGHQGSHVLGGLGNADALAVVPEQVTQVRAGDHLSCLLLDGRAVR